jgi:hypothetical protein
MKTKIGCHTFRATGITEYLRNGGRLEIAQQMANHESARTPGFVTGTTIRCRLTRWSGYLPTEVSKVSINAVSECVECCVFWRL